MAEKHTTSRDKEHHQHPLTHLLTSSTYQTATPPTPRKRLPPTPGAAPPAPPADGDDAGWGLNGGERGGDHAESCELSEGSGTDRGRKKSVGLLDCVVGGWWVDVFGLGGQLGEIGIISIGRFWSLIKLRVPGFLSFTGRFLLLQPFHLLKGL